MIVQGLETNFALLLLMIVLIYYYIRRSIAGAIPEIRPMVGLEAIPEMIGRATEMGRPLHFSTGQGRLTNQYAPMTMAGLAILSYVAGMCAKANIPMIFTCAVAEMMPVVQDTISTAYQKEDVEFDETYTFRYVGDSQQALMASVMGTFGREKPAVNIIAGALFWETNVICEYAAGTGAMQLGATGRIFQIPYCVACCDYALIGEELLVAGAYLSENAPALGSIRGQDLSKFVVLAILILAAIAVNFGSDLFARLLGT